MKHLILVLLFFGLTGPTLAANGVIEVVPGKAGDLQISRLYSVDYQCSVPGSVGGLIGNLKGLSGIVSSGTLVENVSIVSMSAAAAPTNPAPIPSTPGASPPSAGAGAAPATNAIFGTNVLGYSYVSVTNTAINNKCSGQFFISGAENYRIDAQVGISSTNTFADTISKVATLAKNIPIVSDSDQPHNRPSLAEDVSDFVDLLDRHLQSSGLRGDQRAALLKYFAPSLDVEDTTRGYRALGLIFPEITDQAKKSVDGAGLLDALRKSGVSRWLCVQRTKQAVIAPAIPIYDAKIDSAVMVIAAKAGADDKLDKNKTPLFGVHLKFNKSSNNEPIVINRMIFEERYRDIVIKDNNCITDGPKEPTVPTKPSS